MVRILRPFAWAAVLMVANIATGADILLDNTSVGVSTTTSVSVSTSLLSAVIFTVGGTEFTIGEIRVIPVSGVQQTGDLTVALFAASSDVPTGAALASKTVTGVTFVAQSTVSTSDAVTIDTTVGSTGSWQISASQQYAIVFSASVSAGLGVSNPSTALSTGTSGLTFDGRSGSLNSGSTWLGPFGTNITWMQVTAVPEPSTWAMGIIAFGCMTTLAHRRRRSMAR